MLWVPAHRLVEIVDANRTLFQGHGERTSIARRMNELRSGRQEFVSLETADRILTALDLQEFFHLAKEQGGLADIYEDGKQYGSPNRMRLADGRMTSQKYATDEERAAARKRTYREAYERRKLKKAA